MADSKNSNLSLDSQSDWLFHTLTPEVVSAAYKKMMRARAAATVTELVNAEDIGPMLAPAAVALRDEGMDLGDVITAIFRAGVQAGLAMAEVTLERDAQ